MRSTNTVCYSEPVQYDTSVGARHEHTERLEEVVTWILDPVDDCPTCGPERWNEEGNVRRPGSSEPIDRGDSTFGPERGEPASPTRPAPNGGEVSNARLLRRRIVAAGLAGLIGTFALVTTAYAEPGATAVLGRQVAVDTCGGASGGAATFVMTGDLDGCWYTDTFDLVAAGPNGLVVGVGQERFVGCIDDSCGTLFLKFVFVGKFDAGGAELWGGCHHPILGGTGDFAGATGAVSFVDDPDGSGLPPADYTGRVILTN